MTGIHVLCNMHGTLNSMMTIDRLVMVTFMICLLIVPYGEYNHSKQNGFIIYVSPIYSCELFTEAFEVYLN